MTRTPSHPHNSVLLRDLSADQLRSQLDRAVRENDMTTAARFHDELSYRTIFHSQHATPYYPPTSSHLRWLTSTELDRAAQCAEGAGRDNDKWNALNALCDREDILEEHPERAGRLAPSEIRSLSAADLHTSLETAAREYRFQDVELLRYELTARGHHYFDRAAQDVINGRSHVAPATFPSPQSEGLTQTHLRRLTYYELVQASLRAEVHGRHHDFRTIEREDQRRGDLVDQFAHEHDNRLGTLTLADTGRLRAHELGPALETAAAEQRLRDVEALRKEMLVRGYYEYERAADHYIEGIATDVAPFTPPAEPLDRLTPHHASRMTTSELELAVAQATAKHRLDDVFILRGEIDYRADFYSETHAELAAQSRSPEWSVAEHSDNELNYALERAARNKQPHNVETLRTELRSRLLFHYDNEAAHCIAGRPLTTSYERPALPAPSPKIPPHLSNNELLAAIHRAQYYHPNNAPHLISELANRINHNLKLNPDPTSNLHLSDHLAWEFSQRAQPPTHFDISAAKEYLTSKELHTAKTLALHEHRYEAARVIDKEIQQRRAEGRVVFSREWAAQASIDTYESKKLAFHRSLEARHTELDRGPATSQHAGALATDATPPTTAPRPEVSPASRPDTPGSRMAKPPEYSTVPQHINAAGHDTPHVTTDPASHKTTTTTRDSAATALESHRKSPERHPRSHAPNPTDTPTHRTPPDHTRTATHTNTANTTHSLTHTATPDHHAPRISPQHEQAAPTQPTRPTAPTQTENRQQPATPQFSAHQPHLSKASAEPQPAPHTNMGRDNTPVLKSERRPTITPSHQSAACVPRTTAAPERSLQTQQVKVTTPAPNRTEARPAIPPTYQPNTATPSTTASTPPERTNGHARDATTTPSVNPTARDSSSTNTTPPPDFSPDRPGGPKQPAVACTNPASPVPPPMPTPTNPARQHLAALPAAPAAVRSTIKHIQTRARSADRGI